MKKRWYCLILPILTLILEILPYGAVLNFMLPSADGTSVGHFRKLYSYFDRTPFGYANFAPLITAVLSCIVLLLVGVFCLTGQRKWAVVPVMFYVLAQLFLYVRCSSASVISP
jgi:hypothetical protein